jgi:hypothetical protein
MRQVNTGFPLPRVALLLFVGCILALGFVVEAELRWNSEAPPTMSPSADQIFADGFETGDTSRWSDLTPTACPVPVVGLP